MRWPWSDKNRDGRADDQFGDLWIELLLGWIAICLTVLAVGTIAYYIWG
jgi:hypothetical protein